MRAASAMGSVCNPLRKETCLEDPRHARCGISTPASSVEASLWWWGRRCEDARHSGGRGAGRRARAGRDAKSHSERAMLANTSEPNLCSSTHSRGKQCSALRDMGSAPNCLVSTGPYRQLAASSPKCLVSRSCADSADRRVPGRDSWRRFFKGRIHAIGSRHMRTFPGTLTRGLIKISRGLLPGSLWVRPLNATVSTLRRYTTSSCRPRSATRLATPGVCSTAAAPASQKKPSSMYVRTCPPGSAAAS
mmetsp:Transcript_293/g.481  ORF Transcript_293/g.481 Transcript_293/m.481 type:complete len:248 (+) Transcript_293:137-880(+)